MGGALGEVQLGISVSLRRDAMRTLTEIHADKSAILALVPTITNLTDTQYLRAELRKLAREERSLMGW